MDHARSTSTLEDTLEDPWKATDIKPTGDLLSAASCAVAWPSPQEPSRSRGTRDVDAERCDDGSLMNESVVDASADNGGSVATDMDTSPKAVMTALQALRKDVTELKRSSLGMDFPHDRKRQKPEASSGTSDPRINFTH